MTTFSLSVSAGVSSSVAAHINEYESGSINLHELYNDCVMVADLLIASRQNLFTLHFLDYVTLPDHTPDDFIWRCEDMFQSKVNGTIVFLTYSGFGEVREWAERNRDMSVSWYDARGTGMCRAGINNFIQRFLPEVTNHDQKTTVGRLLDIGTEYCDENTPFYVRRIIVEKYLQ